MCGYVINILKGATYEATVKMEGVADIATAQEWRVRCVDEQQAVLLTASSVGANPMMVLMPNTTDTMRLTIPAATTATLAPQTGYFDFEIVWSGNVVRRYISRGQVRIVQKAGA
jgi:hypothetical protein